MYPTLPTEPLLLLDPQSCHINVVQGKQQELLGLEKRYKKKHEICFKTLDRLTWPNACSSSLGITSGILGVVTFSTLTSLSVFILLGDISLAGVSSSGLAMALTKKCQMKLAEVMKFVEL